ncbi:MAG: LptA/OstA family protein [Opitutae bacterium]|nr:LptA/OstA family protein [Opitutae bacterium]
MENVSAFLKIFACATATILAAALPTTLFAEKQIGVDSLAGLQLSGYDNADKLQWTMDAETARPVSGTAIKGDVKHGKWQVENLELTTFSDGSDSVKMKSPSAIFLPEKRRAESDARIDVAGEDFSVTGNGWSWDNGDKGNEVAVKKNVRVELTPEKKGNSDEAMTEKTIVTSSSMKIVETNDATILRFFDNVIVRQGDIRATSDELEILVPAKIEKEKIGEGASGARDLSSSVRKITGTGSVRIVRANHVVTGDTMEFYPANEIFYAHGNAKFTDNENDLEVFGEKAVGRISERRVDITGDANTARKNVVVTLPSAAMQKSSPAAKTSSGADKMVLTGMKLVVQTGDRENVVTLEEKVRLVDGAFRMDCGKLTLFTNAGANEINSDPTATREEKLEAARKIIATEDVKAFQEGRELECEVAEVYPPDKRIVLTGSPSVVSPDEGFSLNGNRCEIFVEEDKIFVYSSPIWVSARRRVNVSLPPMNSISPTGAPKNSATVAAKKPRTEATALETKIVGDDLVISRNSEIATFDITGNVTLESEDWSGNCDRLVVFADSSSGNSRTNSAGKIRRVEALGSVILEEKGMRMSGWHATIENDVEVKEWIAEDDNGADGNSPARITVDPDPDDLTNTRPRLFVPASALGNISLSIGSNEPAGKNDSAATDVVIEGDKLEALAGSARTRFWLRGNVSISTDSGGHGTCDSMEGLLLPNPETSELEPEKIIGRNNVTLAHEGTLGTGDMLEIFPQREIAVLRGGATMSKSDGTVIRPGNDRFIFNMKTHELRTGVGSPSTEHPGQVSRPRITIPQGKDALFVIPQKD